MDAGQLALNLEAFVGGITRYAKHFASGNLRFP